MTDFFLQEKENCPIAFNDKETRINTWYKKNRDMMLLKCKKVKNTELKNFLQILMANACVPVNEWINKQINEKTEKVMFLSW